MLVNRDEALRSIEEVTTREFSDSVESVLSDNAISGLMLDVNDPSEHEHTVHAYVRTEDRLHIFSYFRRNGVEDTGVTSLSYLEVDILRDLAFS